MEEFAGERYRFFADLGNDEWVTVFGGGLTTAIDVRVGPAADGRYGLTGLRIGVATGAEVTAQVLREIKPAEILADYFNAFAERLDVMVLAAHLSRALPPSRGPEDEKLRAFAVAYLTELARQPHRAMTAAAKTCHVSRATAHRWAVLCRERGYLPKSVEGELSS